MEARVAVVATPADFKTLPGPERASKAAVIKRWIGFPHEGEPHPPPWTLVVE